MPSEHLLPPQVAALDAAWVGRTVRVRESVPRLRRFAGRDGVVHAVNQNGRCLVTFDTSADAGWYDVAPGELEIVGGTSEADAPPA